VCVIERWPTPGSRTERIAVQTGRLSKAVSVAIGVDVPLDQSRASTLNPAFFLENEERMLGEGPRPGDP